MSLPGSKGVPMPSFMLIGPKLWALEGYIQTVLLIFFRLYRLALQVTVPLQASPAGLLGRFALCKKWLFNLLFLSIFYESS